jgi:hypothetical protein
LSAAESRRRGEDHGLFVGPRGGAFNVEFLRGAVAVARNENDVFVQGDQLHYPVGPYVVDEFTIGFSSGRLEDRSEGGDSIRGELFRRLSKRRLWRASGADRARVFFAIIAPSSAQPNLSRHGLRGA